MSNNWLYNIRHVVAGEPVQASVVNRPSQSLEDRTNYLKDRLDAAALGRAIFDADATIAEDVEEGDAVFWNAATKRYERAVAAVENDETTQTLVIQPSADCMGLLYSKKSPNLGDVVLRGIVKIPNLTNAIAGADTELAGRYYLSSEQPGKLVKQRPPVTVSVCYVQGVKGSCDPNPWVVVMPQVRDFLESHVHYRFELVPRIAGTGTVVNNRHVINVPDVAMQGWLPANHPTFRRNSGDATTSYAPAGAVFGYNIKAHAAVARVWPPVPVQAVAMLWDKGENRVGATELPLGKDGLAVCDGNGIWWMSDCVGDVPFTTGAVTLPAGGSVPPECPREERMRVIVVFLRMLFGNNRNVVTSLIAAPNSPITVTNCDGLPAKTGDLELDLNLKLAVDPVFVDGGIALKRIDDGNKFRQGWVTEGIVSASPGVIDVQGYSTGANIARPLTTEEKTSFGFDPATAVFAQRGLVKITFNDQLVERELAPQIIRLSDVVERLYRDVPYLGFVPGQESLIRVRFIVPAAGLGTGLKMHIRAQLLGLATDTLPLLTVTYRALPRPDAGRQQALISVDEPALTFPSNVAVAANHVVEVESAQFNVNPGDTVLVTIQRALLGGNPDTYRGEIGLLRLSGIITNSGT
jgi:hypothetical protein